MRVPCTGRAPRTAAAALAAAAALGTSGCAERDPGDLFGPSAAGQLVVQSLLIVDAPLPEVRLSRTTAPDVVPDAGAAERGAAVRVRTAAVVYEYVEVSAGRYLAGTTDAVLPGTEYRLEVTTARGERAAAATTTPARFDVTGWVLVDESTLTDARTLATYEEAGEGVYSRPENGLTYARDFLEARFAAPDAPAIQVGLFSLDPDSDYTIDPDFFEEEDFESLERQTASPPLSGGDGYVRMPWLAVFFQGRYQVKIYAVDRNWYDFVRSDPQLAEGGPGFGGNAGDAFERPIFRVDGAIGLFGSASVDSIGFTVSLPWPGSFTTNGLARPAAGTGHYAPYGMSGVLPSNRAYTVSAPR